MIIKKQSKSRVIKRLDALVSEIVRSRGKCEAEGEGGMKCSRQLQAAHIFSRSHKGTRWDLRNGLCLCSGHHLFWAHKEPYEFAKFCLKRLGAATMDALQIKARQITKLSVQDLLNIEDELKIVRG